MTALAIMGLTIVVGGAILLAMRQRAMLPVRVQTSRRR
jgi:hypothetical protein